MEWFLIKQNNTLYSICIHIDTNNTIDVFVRDRWYNLYHGSSMCGDLNNARMVVLLDMFKQRAKSLNNKWKMDREGITLLLRHDMGVVMIGDLKKPDHCCYMEISPVKKESYISKLYGANEDLMAVIALIDLKTSNQ